MNRKHKKFVAHTPMSFWSTIK